MKNKALWKVDCNYDDIYKIKKGIVYAIYNSFLFKTKYIGPSGSGGSGWENETRKSYNTWTILLN